MTEPPLTPERFQRIQAEFEHALDLPTDDRERHLAELSATDAGLASQVGALLAAHGRVGVELDSPVPAGMWRALERDEDRWVGARVGPYLIHRKIGAGGMGSVYEAARDDDQFQQRVAIKFLHHQAAGETTLRRFRHERQILANLNHPNIANLLDGGVTADGQPYIVMEYVEGLPINRWADDRTLSIRERLQLFEQVCAAVQYAHQSLVVHRDLKPANILVTAEGRVKLLDFGIAKLLREEGSTDEIPATQVGSRALTPEYASPEQFRSAEIGTRSDVYALGVVLFELLSGVRPFDLRGRSIGEIERIVAEEHAPRPSSMLTSDRAELLGERSSTRARSRIEGDLDAIVSMALRKEAERRYGSAEQLSRDVHNHLVGLPVTARPDGWGYRVRKLLRRRRAEAIAVGLAAASLVVGMITTMVQAREARRERGRATEVTSFLTKMLGAADPSSLGRDVSMREVLDSAAVRAGTLQDRPSLEAEIRQIIGGTYVALGEYAVAEKQYLEALAALGRATDADSRAVPMAMLRVSLALEYQGRYLEADSVLRTATQMLGPIAEENDIRAVDLLESRGRVLSRLGRMAEGAEATREALAVQMRLAPGNDSALASLYGNLGVIVGELGDNAESERLLVAGVEAARRAHGDVHPLVASLLSPLGTAREWEGKTALADSAFQAALTMRRTLLGPEHVEYAWTVVNYADLLVRRGRFADALPYAREIVNLRKGDLGEANPVVGTAMNVLGRALSGLDSLAVAEAWLQESLTLRRKHLPEGHWLVASAESALGEHFARAGRFAEAEKLLTASETRLVELRGASASVVADARKRLVDLYRRWGKPTEEAAWRAKLTPPRSGP